MTFHSGEREMQRRAGAESMAAKVGRIILDFIPEAEADFLEGRRFVALGHRDASGRVRASLRGGPAGFVRVVDPRTVDVAGEPVPAGEGALLAIDFADRSRMRVNGALESHPRGFRLRVREAYPNCAKYIQARELIGVRGGGGTAPRLSRALGRDQRDLLGKADTFFISTAPPGAPADVSHRGGNPGFVRVLDERRLEWDDYPGNAMFNTLGNLELDPEAALLFTDFDSGTLLHLTGRARVEGDRRRRVIFEVEAVEETAEGNPYRWTSPGYSPFNPR